MILSAGNYLDRSTGSVYLEIGKSKIYFYERQVVAVVADRVLYRSREMSGGIVYKRVRQAVLASEAMHVSEVSRQELQDMAVGLVMKEVGEEMDKRLLKGKDNGK